MKNKSRYSKETMLLTRTPTRTPHAHEAVVVAPECNTHPSRHAPPDDGGIGGIAGVAGVGGGIGESRESRDSGNSVESVKPTPH